LGDTALDTITGREVLTLLRETVDAMRQTVVMVTHDPVAAAYADTVLFLADGRLVDAISAPTADVVADHMAQLRTLADIGHRCDTTPVVASPPAHDRDPAAARRRSCPGRRGSCSDAQRPGGAEPSMPK
jgi:ABC-type glutathione transport system ATPase component